MKKDQDEQIDVQLEPVGEEFVNKYNATVTTPMLVGGNMARPGHVWYLINIQVKDIAAANKITLPFRKGKRKRKPYVSAVQVQKIFEAEHGIENVKRMVIHHICNKQTFTL